MFFREEGLFYVDYESEKVSKFSGERLWKTALTTPDRDAAEIKRAELEAKGYKVRIIGGEDA